jgi:uncharacterized membrane protein
LIPAAYDVLASTMTPSIPMPPHALVEQTIEQAIEVIRPNFHMGLDLSLALIPFLLALLLFRDTKLPGLLRWPLFAVFVLFLPNAPYVLTDVIHFVAKIRVTPPLPVWAMSILLFEYVLYFLFGMQCFTLSIMLWDSVLKRLGFGWLILPLELLLIAASSFAIYLGRIDRLNSWDVVTDPRGLLDHALRDVTMPKPLELTVIFFVAVTVIHYLLKGMNSFVRFLVSPQAADRPRLF